MKISIIVATAHKNAIGRKGDLLFHISADLRRFKEITMGHPIIMGRKTFESMGCRPLRQRKTYVLTRNIISFQGVEVIHDPEELYSLGGTVWVCGGAHVYKQLLPICDELILSIIPQIIEGDAFFPAFKSYFKLNAVLKQTDTFEVQSWVRNNEN